MDQIKSTKLMKSRKIQIKIKRTINKKACIDGDHCLAIASEYLFFSIKQFFFTFVQKITDLEHFKALPFLNNYKGERKRSCMLGYFYRSSIVCHFSSIFLVTTLHDSSEHAIIKKDLLFSNRQKNLSTFENLTNKH